jgi:alkylation response protein AidB-like acyl-CoA dehydrogenase
MAEATLERVRAAGPLVRARAAECEKSGRLTSEVVAALRDAGVFRMAMSRDLGGPELTPLEQIEVLEELAAADGSAGWCGMINSDGGYVTAFLERDVAKEMYPSLDLPTAVVAAPSAQARVDGDNFVVTGDIAFASGSSHADWFFANCLVVDENGMRWPEGALLPETRMCAVPRDEVEVLDTWHTTGLSATASNDVRLSGCVVPVERTFSLLEGEPVDQSPLYAWRWMFFLNLAGVPLGIGRGALAEATEVAQTKMTFPSMTPARDDPTLQWNLGRAEALVASARTYVFDAVGVFWDTVSSGRPADPKEWISVRLSLSNACTAAKKAVTLLYEALGTTGIYRRSVLDRQLRDITTLNQHVITQTKTYANCGRSRLGLDPGGIAF